MVKKSPKVIVLANIAEQQQRASKAFNIRVRGIPRTDSTPLADATTFVTFTLGIAAHGIEHAWCIGRDLTCPQPLLIRFRNAQAHMAALRHWSTLRDHPTIFMDEDLTPPL